jgi:hypothetical protein
VSSGCAAVLVDDAAEDPAAPDRPIDPDHRAGVVVGRLLVEALMRTMVVEVRDVRLEPVFRTAA